MKRTILAMLLALPLTVQAAPFVGSNTLTFGGAQESSYFASMVSFDAGVNYSPTSGGEFFGHWGNAANPQDFFRFFCIELSQSVTTSAIYTANLVSTSDPVYGQSALNIAKLFDTYYPNKNDQTFYSGGITNFGNWINPDYSTENRASSLAMQLAVWELWLDPTDASHSLYSGTFRANQDNYYGTPGVIVAEAETMLNNISAGDATGWSVYTFKNSGSQDYLSVSYANNVPEPGSLVLLGLSLTGLGFTRKYKFV